MVVQPIIYWRDSDRQCTWGSLKSEKITFLSLNKAVLSNIYGTDRKQGQRRTFIDIMIGEGCHRIQVMESTKEKSGIVFGGSAYHWIALRSFKKSNRLSFIVFCVWICVCVKAIACIYYQKTAIQEFHSNTRSPVFEKRKTDTLSLIGCRQSSNAGVLLIQMRALCPNRNSAMYHFMMIMMLLWLLMNEFQCQHLAIRLSI